MSALENFKLHMWVTFSLDSTGRDYQVQGRGGVCVCVCVCGCVCLVGGSGPLRTDCERLSLFRLAVNTEVRRKE